MFVNASRKRVILSENLHKLRFSYLGKSLSSPENWQILNRNEKPIPTQLSFNKAILKKEY